MTWFAENRRLISLAALAVAGTVATVVILRRELTAGGSGDGNLAGVPLEVGALPVT